MNLFRLICSVLVYSGEYVCDVTLSVYPHRASLKTDMTDQPNALPTELRGQDGSRCDISELSLVPSISM